MNKGIPFIKIADRGEVTVDLPAAAPRRELWSMVDKESVNAQPKPQTIVGLL